MGFSFSQKSLRETFSSKGGMGNKILKRKDMTVAFILLSLIVAVALITPLLSSSDPNAIELKSKNLSPSMEHPLGTDYLGRDILIRLIAGTSTSFSIAAGVTLISLVFGVGIGCISGYYGGSVDEFLSRLIDIFLSFPGIIFALTIMGFLGSGVFNLMLALSIVHWAKYARLMRGQVLSIKENEYVLSARTIGASDVHIMRKHLIPNSIATVIVLATIDIGHVILSIAALNFLGIGLPADIPEWGAMLSAGKEFMRTSPYQTIFPGLAITLVVIIFSIIGEGLRDLFDPRDTGGEF
ncbi:peptide/nickel transport system permease protein [Methanohalophilus levihalophilus]|uniref:ABC transporter permease n=1 Tax=Methanohalophilus levihalophilus TaxID=1431282 RepID=UPI001AE11052|nr:ABC transporter permease [Methanohalophilus levihalophilus]MBP2030788.1 peptide/nickel transport system permease protein [Methanohalophilus levihalophilus]